MLSGRRIAIVLVEQHTDIALELTADAIVLERGAVAHRAGVGRADAGDKATLERLVGLRVDATPYEFSAARKRGILDTQKIVSGFAASRSASTTREPLWLAPRMTRRPYMPNR